MSFICMYIKFNWQVKWYC